MNKKIIYFITIVVFGIGLFFLSNLIESVLLRIAVMTAGALLITLFGLTKKRTETIVVDVPASLDLEMAGKINNPDLSYLMKAMPRSTKKQIIRAKPIRWGFVVLSCLVAMTILIFVFMLKQSSILVTSGVQAIPKELVLESIETPKKDNEIESPLLLEREFVSVSPILAEVAATKMVLDLIVETIQKVSGSIMTAGGAILMIREIKKKKEPPKKRGNKRT